ncbi:MAG: FAD-dependent 5-carboxymethylaminomethyl-2-thiouridine(34) oxidoreductase MnmC [Proteobacteria bacterium]|nr:FAD-dependent 5-carboxymethylaminomethyl-2-thiouridine(34) oxidoreductase MnmC [Pseudomonadota bacterium]
MPPSPVLWRDDGTPASARFGDIYRSHDRAGDGGLAQARHVFLHGCGLLPDADEPAAWAGAPRWAVLETGFGLGLNFLATWQAWRSDPQRPARLHYSAVEAWVCEADDLTRSAAPFAELAPLAAELAAAWHGLLPGVHRIRLDGERVQLNLAVGDVQPMLAELSGAHDSLFLDGFSPERNPDMWSDATFAAAARLLRPGARAATWCVAGAVRQRLVEHGFELERVPGLPPKRQALHARYAPRWTPRVRADQEPRWHQAPARCAIVGGGLAGAAVAFSLAQRGWQVSVLDTAPQPAAGASALPAGVLAPHVSPDDRPLSQLTRAGVRATLTRATDLLRAGRDFAASGVLERHEPGKRRRPAAWSADELPLAAQAESLAGEHPLTRAQAQAAQLPLDEAHPALWHARAGWAQPAALVRAMLGAPGIAWHGQCTVARIDRADDGWRLRDARGDTLAEAELVVIAAGFDSLALLDDSLPLHALRGQVACGPMPGGAADAALPPFPVNGHGSLIAHLPGEAGPRWVTGSTFERAQATPGLQAEDHAANLQRLRELLPQAGAALAAQWADGRAQAWAGVRATLPDRLPAVGAWRWRPSDDFESNRAAAPAHQARAAIDSIATQILPIHLCTGLGARGLTLAVLAGELLAATLHGEPLPVARSLARRLRARRFQPTAAPHKAS